jgi:O-glycosyl hydrolase
MSRTRTLTVLRVAAVVGLLFAGAPLTSQAADVAVTINPSVKYQTIRGWSCNPHYLEGGKEQREQVIDEAVDSLGITRIRWQQPNGNRSQMTQWEPENDNGDPDLADLSRFNTADADEYVEGYVLPFKRRIETRGDPFELWLSPSFFDGGSTGSVAAFLLESPGEYAEYATSFITYLRDRYGIQTNHYAICNEAGNNNAFSPAVVAEMTRVLGERLEKLGLPTRGQFSDGVNARVTWNYIQYAKDDPELWKHVDVLSYHWYGGENQQWMAKIREFADEKGLDTAQTEFMHLKIDHLYDDLTIGAVSYWSIYGLGGPGPGGQNFWLRPDDTSFRRGPQFWNFRQVMHYVRPGAVRIAVESGEPSLRTLAFARDGRVTVVLINTTPPAGPRSVTVRGLPTGSYGLCRCVNSRPYEELGVKAVEADGQLSVDLPANSVLTIYPHPGENLAPVVVNWEAGPTFLKRPGGKITLSAAAQDPELDRLTFSWTVARQPQGAAATIADPQSATTEAEGLAVAGQYAFTVAITDGTNEVKRDVLLNVYEGNQPPRLMDLHNRIPVIVTLPHGETLLRGGAFDLEDDKLSFRWSVVKQPPGSAVKLESPSEPACKATNITVPGDHVFRLEASDGASTVSEDLAVPVYPPNSAPVIAAANATPAVVTRPDDSTLLSATTSDPDGDVISHWWRVKSRPPGARPVFANQGGRDTKISGLTVEGIYTFELTVVDRTKAARKDVVVNVAAKESSLAPAGQFTDPPAQWAKDERRIVARGTAAGTVLEKGRAFVVVRSNTGATARYIPRWTGGNPSDGGGPEPRIVEAIARLRAGDRVKVRWYVNDHVRIEDIQQTP